MTAAMPLAPYTPTECQSHAECGLARKCLGDPICGRNLREAAEQTSDAILDLHRDPESFIRWPWAALDNLTFGLAAGSVWYVVAFSGIGKTTFVGSATNRWIDQGRKVYVMPLETEPKTFRTYLACQRLGIRPGDAFSGELRRRNGPELKALEQEIRSQASTGSEHLRIAGVQEIHLKAFRSACEDAANFGAQILIVDHIDHVQAGDGSNLYAESVKVNRAALKLAQEMGLLLVLCSQLNNDALKGQDHLAKFGPPREQHVKFGTHKREIATGMLGLFRPTRPMKHGEDPKEFQETMKRARTGELEPHNVLQPHTMGVVYMKDRNYGTDGRKTTLAVVNGRVEDSEPRSDADRYAL